MQHTVLHPVILSGVGLHSGAETSLRILPAGARTGLRFVRTDVTDRDNMVPARWDAVVDTRLCTVVGNDSGVTVATIEHLMAALSACGVDNAVIELDGPEVPIMDGSSEPFVDAILMAGLKIQTAPRRALKILREVNLNDGEKRVTLKPAVGSRFAAEIEFSHPAIGRQFCEVDMFSGDFLTQISDARTFGFSHEVTALRAMGLALGGSLENAIVLDPKSVLNPEGLRYADEFARHKVLDAVGDIYLAGGPLIGLYQASRPGHAMNNQILRQLFATPGAWAWIDLYMDTVPVSDQSGTLQVPFSAACVEKAASAALAS